MFSFLSKSASKDVSEKSMASSAASFTAPVTNSGHEGIFCCLSISSCVNFYQVTIHCLVEWICPAM